MKTQHPTESIDDPSSFLDVLRWRALRQPEQTAFVFNGDGDKADLSLTYGELDRRARTLGGLLQERFPRGERALLVYPPGLEFLAAFFGCLYAGVVAVPVYPPRPNRPMPRLKAIVADCTPGAVLTTESLRSEAPRWFAQVPELQQPQWLATDLGLDSDDRLADAWRDPGAGPATLAFLQYTSGSTAAAKGVMVSHGNLVRNSDLIGGCFASTEASRGVFWLPLHHDMGLIGGVLQTLHCGGTSTLMSPVAFLQRPFRWLQAISETRATISGGPNFAYDLCVRKVTDEQRASLDLSRWTVAFNGAEPVRAETLERFAEAFAPCGFRREAFLPCYGLAESTLLVSGGPAETRPVVVSLATAPLEQNQIVPAPTDKPGSRALVSSGRIPAGQVVAIVDPETCRRCAPDRVGEIWVSGPSVASGYWNQPEITKATFHATLADTGEGPFLRTGDLGFVNNGELIVTGRLKDLIIVRGRNVYPQDVERTVEQSHPALRPEGGAAFSVEIDGDEQLVVIHEVERQVKGNDVAEILLAIRRAVAEQHDLDVHAICLIKAGSLPKTSSGKVQRHASRALYLAGTLEVVGPQVKEPETAGSNVAPSKADREHPRATEIEAWLIARVAATLGIQAKQIDTQTPFAGYGLSSLQAVGLAGELQDWLGQPLSPTLVYEYPTIGELAGHLAGAAHNPVAEPGDRPAEAEPIAIIGVGCRFPGADGPESFWRLLHDGVDAIGAVPVDRWETAASNGSGKGVPPWGGFLDQVDRFDADFFGISPREAVRTDPQQRLLLELAWEALEDAGQAVGRLAGTRTGVYVGISTNDYGRLQWDRADSVDPYIVTGNAASIAANRLSYLLDFRGPSLAIDTACSSSLVAVHLACQSLRNGEATLALAGGVNVLLSREIGANFAEAGFLAPDGRCKAFDSRADGYVRAEGAGFVVLKPLSRALADGDPIRALIRGGAVNQDGRSNGLTAPSRQAQEAVLRDAYRTAGVAPGQVQYVEAHGTGTALGDPIEARALGNVLAEGRPADRPCLIGTVKSNIGHLEAAAGIAGLIKTVLTLQHRVIPPSLHFENPSPHIPFAELGIEVQGTLRAWPTTEGPALAGVSAFGFGGTNAHLVLEAAPSPSPAPALGDDDDSVLLPLSARSPEALRALATSYRDMLASSLDEISLQDIAQTASVRRNHHEHRRAVVARSLGEAAAQLTSEASEERLGTGQASKLVLVCSGQGAKWRGAGRLLFEREPVFRAALEQCEACFKPLAGWSLLAQFLADEPTDPSAETEVAQPVTLALQVALAALWRSWGIVPDAIVGHSLGEIAAAHLAGAFDLEDAFRIAYHRGRLMRRVAGFGLTAALGLAPHDAQRLVDDSAGRLSLVALNGPEFTTVSGDPNTVRELVDRLKRQDVFARILDVDCAFHSPQMDPLLGEFAESLAGLQPRATTIPLVSTVTGKPIAGEALDAAYWGRNLRQTVLFAPAIETLLVIENCPTLFLELGAHPVLGASITRILRQQGRPGISLPSLKRGEDERGVILRSLGTLYTHGFNVDWPAVAPAGRCAPLPAYPWQRERFWLEPAAKLPSRNGHSGPKNGKPLEPSIAEWLYELDWIAKEPTARPEVDSSEGPWLILEDSRGVGQALRAHLEARGIPCELVPCVDVDLEGLLKTKAYHGIVHLGSLDTEVSANPSLAALDDAERKGVGSVLPLIQALGNLEPQRDKPKPKLWLVTRGAQPTTSPKPVYLNGNGVHKPKQANDQGLAQTPLWGMGRSIALEYAECWGGLIDLDPEAVDGGAAALAAELLDGDGEDQVALRSQGRYVPRLVRRKAPAPHHGAPLVRPEGTYLITGGLGELGLQAARWLAERGARRLVLVSRRPLPLRTQWERLTPGDIARKGVAAIQDLERLGATVVVANADVADPEAMAALFERLQATLPPIVGILHTAGFITNESTRDLDRQTLAAVLRPKVAGTLVLDALSRDLPLDFFGLFSSVASILGAKEAHYAAANAFLDAFAHVSKAQGRPVLSVNWGPWAGAGMAASPDRMRAFHLLGFKPLEPDRAFRVLEGLIHEGRAQALVADVDWSGLKRLHAEEGNRHLLEKIEETRRPQRDLRPSGRRELADWRNAPLEQRRETLVRYFRDRVAGVLRLEPDRIDPARPLNTLGLDSLMAIELKGGVEADLGTILPLTSLMTGPTITELADQAIALERAPAPSSASLASREPVFEHPLSFGQQSLWHLHRLDPTSTAYNIAGAARVPIEVDVAVLRRSLQRLVDRHAALRTTFAEVNGRPVQRIHEAATVSFLVEDVSAWDEAAIHQRLIEEADRPFDLETGPLFRTALFSRSPREHYLLLAVHHIVSDFWAVAVLLHELGLIVPAERAGVPVQLTPLAIQYTDYVRWQAEMLAGTEGERLWTYWRDQLAGPLPTLALPTDRPRPAVQSQNGAARTIHLDRTLIQRLTRLGQEHGASLYVTLLAAFQALLARQSGQDDLIVGSPVAGRDHQGQTQVVGHFVNPLPLRADLSGNPTFAELLGRARRTVHDGLEHQDYPFTLLVERLQPTRDLSRSPLFQVLFTFQKAQRLEKEGLTPFALREQGPRLDLGGFPLESVALEQHAAQFDLAMTTAETEEGLAASIEYNTDLFDRETVDRMLERFRILLEGIADAPETHLADLPLLTVEERQRVLVAWNDTAAERPTVSFIHHLFEAQAKSAPDANAVIDAHGRSLSYGELEAKANRLAHHLVAQGVSADSRVGLCVDGSPEMVVGILGILKAGAAYLPLDPDYPRDRLATMVDDAQVALILSVERLLSILPGDLIRGRVILLDSLEEASSHYPSSPPVVDLHPDNLAYVIYTSGSTGKPKGVPVSHRNLVHSTESRFLHYRQPVRGFLLLSSFAFDSSVAGIFWTLSQGGTLVLPSRGSQADPAAIADLVQRQQASHLLCVPSLLNLILDEAPHASLLSLNTVIVAGEFCPRDLPDRLWARLPEADLFNEYGPTEATVWCTVHRCDQTEVGTIPIGRPIANTQAYLLDAQLQPVPIGVAGELYIGGDGIARGYLNRPALTAERFLPDPFGKPGARIYRTGDLARWRADGTLEYLGRIDHQVKIRGHRIELGEVEDALNAHPHVQAAVAMARPDAQGNAQLVAYLVTDDDAQTTTTTAELRRWLKNALPEPMIPSAFVLLDALPLTPNGKVDRNALPNPKANNLASGEPYEAPRTQAETLVAQTWELVLKRERVGIHDDFFELGGHSLLATQVVSRLRDAFDTDIPLRTLFEATTVAALAQRLDELQQGARGVHASSIVAGPSEGPIPASFAQQRLWFLDQLEPGSPLYNIPLAIQIDGPLDSIALHQALDEIVRRHQALRTTFRAQDGRPIQVFEPVVALPLTQIDLSSWPLDRRQAEVAQRIDAEAKRPFDLTHGPLIHADLLRLEPTRHVLLLTMHHIISDGWSLGVLIQEAGALYDAFAHGRPSPLPALPIQYADYALWQRQWLQGQNLNSPLDYWTQQLAGVTPLEIPTDRPRPPALSYRGGERSTVLAMSLLDELRNLGRQEGATLFMTLTAAFQTLLHRVSGQNDITVGSPVAGRTRPETEGLIGFFLNTLVLRAELSGELSFRQLLRQTKPVVLDAFAHQDLPFEQIVEAVSAERDPSRSPLFQAMLILQNAPLPPLATAGLTMTVLEPPINTAKFDLTLKLTETDQGLHTALEYSTDLFDASTVDRMLGWFETLLEGITANPEAPLADLPLLSRGERNWLLDACNDTGIQVPDGSSVPRLFEAQARRTPDATAVIDADGSTLTYAQLDHAANQLAHHLRSLSAGPNTLVALCTDRSPDMLVTLLAVLKAGAAYLPLDPEYPRDRLEFMLRDSGAAILLTQRNLKKLLPDTGARTILLDDDRAVIERQDGTHPPDVTAHSASLAYVIYTSGSTGKPKGVMIPHDALTNFILAMRALLGLEAGDSLLAVTTLSFDIAVLELFVPLIVGARIQLASRDEASDGQRLAKRLHDADARFLQATPATWRLLLDSGWQGKPGLAILCGGEAMTRELAERLIPKADALWNLYGPTETTVWSAAAKVETGNGSVSIGRPIANTQIYILDARLQPLPIGVAGELYIGGDGIARGYLNRPALTAERFLPDPFGKPGARIYRTGDLARWRADGTLECLGRIDHQVKIRGHRIELGEVEDALNAHPHVQAAVAVARPDAQGNAQLVAYLVTDDDAQTTTAELRRWLKNALPEPMIPSAFVLLDALPLTPNGKVDRNALPNPDTQLIASGVPYEAPRNQAEALVTQAWEQILKRERVSIHDNFFELGGHSLLATQVVSRLRDAFDTDIPLRTLFEATTVATLAQRLDELQQASRGTSAPPLRPAPRDQGPLPASFAQQRLWFLDQLEPGSPLYNIPLAIQIDGPLDSIALQSALDEVVRRHESLRTHFLAKDGRPIPVFAPDLTVALPTTDLSTWPLDRRQAEVANRMEVEARRPFDLAHGPLIHAALLSLDQGQHILLLTLHHVIADGWSLGVLVREAGALYDAFAQGRPSPLPPLPIQYADYALWQRQWLQGQNLNDQLAYWTQQLAGVTPLEIPTDRPRPPALTHQGGERSTTLALPLVDDLRKIARQEGATLFMTLVAAFQTLLHRVSGQNDITIGSPVAGRTRSETEGLIGFFLNTLVLRAELSGELSFRQLLRQTKPVVLDAFAHQDLPFEQIVEAVSAERDPSRSPLFQAMLILQNAPLPPLATAGLTMTVLEPATATAKFDLTLKLTETDQGLHAALEYATDLFESTTVDRMLGWFRTLLEGIVANPEIPLADLPLLTDDERQRVLVEWNAEREKAPSPSSLPPLVQPQPIHHGNGILDHGHDLDGLSDDEVESLLQSLLVDDES
ncbi:hybrid non-ribosomal peptide synthetase/type I polyketide synthase [Singulisphaera acidiphila]|uniref:Amino acid adenylation enzyme/thioester reductase family protein n=3 Tax=Singulisphaera acidiphila TaxID=466153 RepID=L0DP05_SINAD|nr:hybrid non-ribosomal peptide synthetase/type I polyketide synthase [Singulisphaera acidiphila]AGA31109.1 amino acid adenylation enzyme/thioester reductase family protein [Singulisphaera acidiphila DSM 18658]